MKEIIKLSNPGIYIPQTNLTNNELEGIVDTNDEWIKKRTGIEKRTISFEMNVKEMAVRAVMNALEKNNYSADEIDEIIFSTNRHHNEQEFPNHASYVREKIGGREGIPTSDITAGCTGIIYAIRQAFNTLKVEKDKKKILVIGAEKLSAMTDYSDRSTCILFGDAAGAYILEKKNSLGEGIIKNIPLSKSDIGNEEWPNGFLGLEKKEGKNLVRGEKSKFETRNNLQNYLVMNGQEVFKFAVGAVEDATYKVLEDTPYSIEDLDVIIPHGANKRIIDYVEKRISKEGFKGVMFSNLERYGNTSTASIPLAHSEAIDKNIIEDGALCALVGFGAGLTWGATLFRQRI